MKTLKFYLLSLLLGAAVIISGCEDDNDPVGPGPVSASGSITLNGGGYDNVTMNITSGSGIYDASQNETFIGLRGTAGGDTASILITFNGNSTGNFSWMDTLSYVSFYTDLSTQYLSIDGAGSTTITSYGSVGNFIEGNISGTLSLFPAADSINISGNFRARRSADE